MQINCNEKKVQGCKKKLLKDEIANKITEKNITLNETRKKTSKKI